MAWCFVCPANRGIGFALTRHLLQTTKVPIIATARKDTEGVKKVILSDLHDVNHDRLTVLEVDVTDESTISNAAATCKQLFPPPSLSSPSPSHSNPPNHLRLAFCLPGILLPPERSPSQITASAALSTFQINTIGPMLLMKHFSPFLPRERDLFPPSSSSSSHNPSKSPQEPFTPQIRSPDQGEKEDGEGLPSHATFATLAARLGSTSDNALGGWYTYRASKAALFSLTKGLDIFLQQRCGQAAIAIALHPGTVRTGLSKGFVEGRDGKGKEKEKEKDERVEKEGRGVRERKDGEKLQKGDLLEPEEAAERLVDVVRGLNVKGGRGKCWDWRGTEIFP